MVPAPALQIQEVSIDELRPDPANPRRISDAELESLTRSLREFGFVQPVLARREDKVVIGGHQRLIAARRLGIKSVPVVFVDLSQEQARLLNLALNRISGTWDQELLARLLAELKEVPDVDLSLSGFSEDELKKYLKGLESREKRERVESFDLDAALEAAPGGPCCAHGRPLAPGRPPTPVRRCHQPGRRGAPDEWTESLLAGHRPTLPGGLLGQQ